MKLSKIAWMRLHSQQIAASRSATAKDLVAWMGAIQAQDYPMSKWAVGVRLPEATDREIEESVNRGKIIRTHLLRPTWHLVSAEDVRWMLALTAPHIKTLSGTRNRELELTEDVFGKSNAVLEKALAGGKQLTRPKLSDELEKAGIATHKGRLSHLLYWAELDGILCSGAVKDGKQTYALLDERVPKKNTLPREEALEKLARRYFTSHGPATLKDFEWWSGLSIRDARRALDMIKSDFDSESVNSRLYFFSGAVAVSANTDESIHLLPAYDEFIISYTDRSPSLTLEDRVKAVSKNGLFRPVITLNGQVIGTWKRTFKKEKVLAQMDFFITPSETTKGAIENAFRNYGRFLDKEVA